MKEWEGLIEKEFTFVLYADVDINDTARSYYFRLHTDGKDSCKTPPMFFEGKTKVPNDSAEVIKEIRTVINSQK